MKKLQFLLKALCAAGMVIQLAATAQARNALVISENATRAVELLNRTEAGQAFLADALGVRVRSLKDMSPETLRSKIDNMDANLRNELITDLKSYEKLTQTNSNYEQLALQLRQSSSFLKAREAAQSKGNNALSGLKLQQKRSVYDEVDAMIENMASRPVEELTFEASVDPALRSDVRDVMDLGRRVKASTGKDIWGSSFTQCLGYGSEALETALVTTRAHGESLLRLGSGNFSAQRRAYNEVQEVFMDRTRVAEREANERICRLSKPSGKCRIFAPDLARIACN